MAIPDTENLNNLFISDRPDWSEGVELIIGWPTTVNTARSGLEQRTRNSQYPKFRMDYVNAALSAAEYALRRTRAHSEVVAPIVVPLWPIEYEFSSKLGQIITLTETAQTWDNILKDEYLFITDPAVSDAFFTIEAVSGATVTVTQAISALYGANTRIYPCLKGVRSEGRVQFKSASLGSLDEVIAITGL